MKPFRSPIARLTNNLYLCGIGCITEENLIHRNITHVLNTAEELREFVYPTACHLSIEHILMRDSEDQNLLEDLDICVDHINHVVESGGNILVHCVAGVSRSASVCIAYLMKYKNMSLKAAYTHVFDRRPCIFPNFGFWRQLCTYEVAIHGKSTVELLPFVIGWIPDTMKIEAERRIKLAWMPELQFYFGLHFFIMFLQIIWLYFS